jgi:glycosyltransferase involved in cell wall biosynthesis
MMRVLILSGVRGDTRRYRAFHLYQQLRLGGAPAVLSDITDPEVLRLADGCGLVVLHRAAWDRTVRGVMARVRAGGGVVLYDTDDLVFDPAAFDWIDSPDFADPVRARLYRQQLERQRQTLEAADGVLVSTPYLAEAVRRLGKPGWVHPNAYDLEMAALSERAYAARRPDPAQAIIGYASGTLTHNRDFALVRPALEAVLGRFPQARLLLIGALDPGPGWGDLETRVHRLPLLPWRELPAALAGLDINLAPLVTTNPFAQSKSAIKYLEAALVGVPTVASPTAAFREAIRPGQNGLLAEDPAAWQAALAGLVADPARRVALSETARADALARYGPVVRSAELGQLLAEIGVRLGHPDLGALVREPIAFPPDPAAYYIPRRYEQHPNRVEQGFYLLRQGESRRLLGMIWVQVRRLLAPLFPFKKRAHRKEADSAGARRDAKRS